MYVLRSSEKFLFFFIFFEAIVRKTDLSRMLLISKKVSLCIILIRIEITCNQGYCIEHLKSLTGFIIDLITYSNDRS